MPDLPNLTSATVMIVLATAIIVPQLRLRDARKRLILRCVVVCLAAIVYLIITVPHLRAYPPTTNDTVYITKTGEKYHTTDCSHLRKSKIPIIMADAVAEGYDDCSHCDPPEYRTEEIRVTLSDLYAPLTLEDAYIPIAALAMLAVIYAIFFFIDRHIHRNNNSSRSHNSERT